MPENRCIRSDDSPFAAYIDLNMQSGVQRLPFEHSHPASQLMPPNPDTARQLWTRETIARIASVDRVNAFNKYLEGQGTM
jgi:hypothetical protein